jgi:hypothetical protein
MANEGAPDTETKIIRFVCGFIFFGGVSLLFIGTQFASLSGHVLLLSALSIGFVAGLVAMYYGDSFWLRVKDWLP